MRIFMLVQHPSARGPVPRHTAHLVAALQEIGCTVTTHPWGQRRGGESLPAKVRQRAADVLSVRRAARAGAFDIAVVKTAHDWRTLARDVPVLLALRSRIRPLVLQFHGSRVDELHGPGRWAFKCATSLLLLLADGVLVLSAEEQRQWQAVKPNRPAFVVKNPYVSMFGPREAVDYEGGQSSAAAPRVLFVGRLIEEKGVFDLLDAAARIPPSLSYTLALVGEGRAEEAVRKRIGDLGLADRVHLVGYAAGDELRREYERAALLVLPSWSEGFPTVLAEAMDAGLPIVTTRIRGAVDHLVEGEHALFVKPRDVDGLAAALATLLLDDGLRARMGAVNRDRVKIFEPVAVAREYVQALEAIAPAARTGRAAGSGEGASSVSAGGS